METQQTFDSYEEFNIHAKEECRQILKTTTVLGKLMYNINYCLTNEDIELVALKTRLKTFENDMTALNDDISKEFKIVCVGLEKAGKSSLINAWLEFDLLPTDIKRCTNAITEVRSCDSLEEQRYRIEYFTKNEFIRYKDELNAAITVVKETLPTKHNIDYLDSRSSEERIEPSSTELNVLLKEIEEINKYDNDIIRQIDSNTIPKEGPLKEGFDDASTRDLLKQAISNPAHARAVKRVIIWSSKLSTKRNIVLIDVPGYNSPLKNHKDQTKNIIQEADAILFVKNLTANSNIELSENDILKHIDNKRFKLLSAKERFIVALTQIDRCTNKSSFIEYRKNAEQEWFKNDVSHDRIVNCCTYLRLNKSNPTADKMSVQEVSRKLKEFCGNNDGIDELKTKIDELIVTKYRRAIQLRFTELTEKFTTLKESIVNYGKIKFPIDKKDKNDKESQLNIKQEILNKWWAEKWQNISQQFQLFCQRDVFPKDKPDDLARNKYLEEFRSKYIEMVDKIGSNIQVITDAEKMRALYCSVGFNGGIISPDEGHVLIRKELNHHMYREMSGLSEELADILCKALEDILKWIHENLWGIDKIKETLLEVPLDVKRKTYADRFETLILRLARPANDLFLRYPRFSARRKTIQNYYREVTLLDLFYQPKESENSSDNEKSEVTLPEFLANGYNSQNVNIDYHNLKFDVEGLTFADNCGYFDAVKDECTEDFNELIKYLKNSIYYASGIESLFIQELDRIISRFSNLEIKEGKWQHLVYESIRKGNDYLICPTLIEKLESRQYITNVLQKLDSDSLHLSSDFENDESIKNNETNTFNHT